MRITAVWVRVGSPEGEIVAADERRTADPLIGGGRHPWLRVVNASRYPQASFVQATEVVNGSKQD